MARIANRGTEVVARIYLAELAKNLQDLVCFAFFPYDMGILVNVRLLLHCQGHGSRVAQAPRGSADGQGVSAGRRPWIAWTLDDTGAPTSAAAGKQ